MAIVMVPIALNLKAAQQSCDGTYGVSPQTELGGVVRSCLLPTPAGSESESCSQIWQLQIHETARIALNTMNECGESGNESSTARHILAVGDSAGSQTPKDDGNQIINNLDDDDDNDERIRDSRIASDDGKYHQHEKIPQDDEQPTSGVINWECAGGVEVLVPIQARRKQGANRMDNEKRQRQTSPSIERKHRHWSAAIRDADVTHRSTSSPQISSSKLITPYTPTIIPSSIFLDYLWMSRSMHESLVTRPASCIASVVPTLLLRPMLCPHTKATEERDPSSSKGRDTEIPTFGVEANEELVLGWESRPANLPWCSLTVTAYLFILPLQVVVVEEASRGVRDKVCEV
ncbi:hypothetical protein EI94DRAFT_1790132 [Lactarius quietus]|nr:hypothetical protein EI94DRAFT_1790132 [Lactarius quietus]